LKEERNVKNTLWSYYIAYLCKKYYNH